MLLFLQHLLQMLLPILQQLMLLLMLQMLLLLLRRLLRGGTVALGPLPALHNAVLMLWSLAMFLGTLHETLQVRQLVLRELSLR